MKATCLSSKFILLSHLSPPQNSPGNDFSHRITPWSLSLQHGPLFRFLARLSAVNNLARMIPLQWSSRKVSVGRSTRKSSRRALSEGASRITRKNLHHCVPFSYQRFNQLTGIHLPFVQRRWYARNQADHAAYEHGRVKHNPSKQLLYSIQRGERDTSVFDDLVARGATIWDRDSATSDSALHLAVIAENPVAVKWLLEQGLPWWVSAVDEKNKYAIGRAIKGGECWKVLMNWMVESGMSSSARV